ncbi:protein phosphatase 1A isoform X2 [Nematostella vectensis]|uniref:protein phosphatase 1A isoform X2 n=1 Tax=Nematostella vectensis TaxID=45351 RepID=UPI0020774186|nr:protein phosphatase 1A isoform X2 [Nematostella vectensis]
MGAFLDKPRTEKETKTGEGNGLRYGLAAMQGWRVEMEDAHTAVIGLSDHLKDWSFFAVFDGHAGENVSKYCSSNLHETLLKHQSFEAAIKESSDSPDLDQLRSGLRDAFLELDSTMQKLPKWSSGEDKSGSTAIALLVTPKYYIFANCGDSRGILSHNGEVIYNTVDHKPGNPDEKSRIENAGGSVMIQRVNGALAVSRALGDFEYKLDSSLHATKQLVSPEPDIFFQSRSDQDEFIVLACDGVWDVMTNDEVGAFVRSRLQITDDLQRVSCELLDTCLTKGSRDNMSVIIISLPGSPKVTDEAIKNEQKVEAELEAKLEALLEEETNLAEVDVSYAMQSLSQEEIQGLPPGGGLASKAGFIQGILEKLVQQKCPENCKVNTPGAKKDANGKRNMEQ